MQKQFNITATGATDPVPLDGSRVMTAVSVGTGATDYSLDLEVQLVKGGAWHPAQTMVDGNLYSTQSGALAVRYNCSSLGAASAIVAEVGGN